MAQWQEEVAKWEENGKVGKKPGKPRKLKDDFSLFNQEELYYIPKYWKFVLPQQLCSLQKYSIGIGPFGSNLKVSDYTDEGVPLVFVRNITRNSFDRNLKFISQEKFLDLIPHSVHPGDILVTKMGDPPGDVTIYPNGKPIGIITSDCLKFRPLEGFADNKFYKYYLESVFTKKQLGVITMGVAQKKISLTRFKTIFLPLLSYEEQRQIVQEIESRLSVCDKFLESIEASLKKAEALRQSILKKAFEGTLLTEAELEACRQEPDWEPAEALLARIQGKKV
ncbi:MAG: restriction endonuclease subunit S [Bacteroidota bacterium]